MGEIPTIKDEHKAKTSGKLPAAAIFCPFPSKVDPIAKFCPASNSDGLFLGKPTVYCWYSTKNIVI